jgi:hypothetical protein
MWLLFRSHNRHSSMSRERRPTYGLTGEARTRAGSHERERRAPPRASWTLRRGAENPIGIFLAPANIRGPFSNLLETIGGASPTEEKEGAAR